MGRALRRGRFSTGKMSGMCATSDAFRMVARVNKHNAERKAQLAAEAAARGAEKKRAAAERREQKEQEAQQRAAQRELRDLDPPLESPKATQGSRKRRRADTGS